MPGTFTQRRLAQRELKKAQEAAKTNPRIAARVAALVDAAANIDPQTVTQLAQSIVQPATVSPVVPAQLTKQLPPEIIRQLTQTSTVTSYFEVPAQVVGTSTSTITVSALGNTVSITTDSDIAATPGTQIVIADQVNRNNWFAGTSKVYNTTTGALTLVVNEIGLNASITSSAGPWNVFCWTAPPVSIPLYTISGLRVTSVAGTSTFSVTPGSVRDSTDTLDLVLTSSLTGKKLDTAFSAGNNGGAVVTSANLTGTITETIGNATVTGTSSKFTTELGSGAASAMAGLTDYVNQGSNLYSGALTSIYWGPVITPTGGVTQRVSSIASDTALTLVLNSVQNETNDTYVRGGTSGTEFFVCAICLVRKDSDGSIDAIVTSMVTPSGNPDLPAGYTYFRVIAAVVVSGGQIAVATRKIDQPLYGANYEAGSPTILEGDLVYFTGGRDARLAVGFNKQVLVSNGTDPAWGTVDLASGLTGGVSGILPLANGGTGQTTASAAFDALAPTTTRGDVIVRGASSNARVALGSSGQVLTSNGTDPVWSNTFAGSVGYNVPSNLGLAASVASNILTIAIKDSAGNDPTVNSTVIIPFRNTTLATGTPSTYTLNAAKSIATTVGASLGTSASTAFRFWIVAVYDGTNFDLGLINCSTATQIFPINETQLYTTVTLNGSSTAAGTIYAGTGRASQAIRIIGLLEYGSTGLATPGTYASGPALLQLFGPGVKKPGDIIQTISATDSTQETTTSSAYVATTNGRISITPTSAANLIRATMYGGSMNTGAANITESAKMSRGTTNNTNMIGSEQRCNSAGGATETAISLRALDKPNTTSATTYTLQFRNSDNATAVFVLPGGGGSIMSMQAEEIMG